MDQHGKRSQLVSINNSVLSRVAGGESMDDVFDSWSWQFATESCQWAVQGARLGAARAAYDSGGDAWGAANQAGLNAWNGPDCSYLGWFSGWF